MTLVHFSLTVPAPDGTLTPAAGMLRFTPTARRIETGAPDKIVLPKPFTVQLVAGLADVTLNPTAATWAWQVDEYPTGVPARTIHVQVPDTTEADYTDLVTVDPATLAPTPAPQAAWVTQANLTAARNPETMFTGTITRNAAGAPTSATVTWPDGTTGTYTGTPSTTYPSAIDSYTITHGATTYTQPAVTRDANGNITNQPDITVS